ncbi:hypothetical protein Tco_1286114 [Tanacetum coccineum]
MASGIDNLANHLMRLSWAHLPDNSSRLYDHKSPFALQYHLRTFGIDETRRGRLHLAFLKFITKEGITIVRGERLQTNICNQISQKRDHLEETNDTGGVEHIIVNEEHSEQTLAITSNLPKTLKEKLRELLHSNKDIFVWTPADMTSIPRELAKHRLNIHPRIFPVWQKKRVITKDRSEAITVEVSKLVEERISKSKRAKTSKNRKEMKRQVQEKDLKPISKAGSRPWSRKVKKVKKRTKEKDHFALTMED